MENRPTQLQRMENELKLAGYKLEPVINEQWTEDDYVQQIGNSVYEICKIFCNQGHSGMSADLTKQLLKKLLIDEDTLTPLTNNPDEWINITEESNRPLWQSKRKSSCFSDDNLKTYYDIDDGDNKEYYYENGVQTEWYHIKSSDKLKRIELKESK